LTQCLARNLLSASMPSNLAAFLAFVESNLDAPATVVVLSHQHATCVWAKSAKFFNTHHCKMSPTISKSELEIFPCGFSCNTSCCWISGGNSTRQTIGGSCLSIQNQTPPAPFCDASQPHSLPMLVSDWRTALVVCLLIQAEWSSIAALVVCPSSDEQFCLCKTGSVLLWWRLKGRAGLDRSECLSWHALVSRSVSPICPTVSLLPLQL